jgi:hypothetical protein
MFADVQGPGTWGLKKVYATKDSEGRLAIGFELDENGAKLFAQLTKNNVGNHLAILVDGKVLSIVKVTSTLPEKGVIAGSFAQEDIDNIVTALRKGMQLAKTDVQVEGKADKLEFRIIPEALGSSRNPIDLSPQQIERYFQALQKDGPQSETQNTDYMWLELDENVKSDLFLKKRYQGKLYVLVSNRKHEIMLDDGSWYVNFVDRQRDNNSAIRYHSVVAGFDEYGRHLFSSLTNNNIGKSLAIIKDSKVVFASIVQRRMFQAAITGDFTEKQTASLMSMFEQCLQVQLQHDRKPFLWDIDRQTWREYIDTKEALAKGQDRAKLAKAFLTIGSKYPQTTHCQTAIELGHLLENMVKEDKQFEEPEDIQALNQFKKAEYYIYKLRDVSEQDISVPGKIHFLRNYTRVDTPITALREMGMDVVPVMIRHLEDRRPTRSVGSLPNGGVITRNCDVALEIIESIADRKFDFRTARGTYLSTASEKLRDRIIEDVKEWWQRNKQQSGVQVEAESLSSKLKDRWLLKAKHGASPST